MKSKSHAKKNAVNRKRNTKSMTRSRMAHALAGMHKRNPSPRDADAAARLFKEFTGHAATKEAKYRAAPIRTALKVGPLAGVMYVATRDGKQETYFHKFKSSSRPLLIANHDGSSIGIVGGRYRFTDRGIVDE